MRNPKNYSKNIYFLRNWSKNIQQKIVEHTQRTFIIGGIIYIYFDSFDTWIMMEYKLQNALPSEGFPHSCDLDQSKFLKKNLLLYTYISRCALSDGDHRWFLWFLTSTGFSIYYKKKFSPCANTPIEKTFLENCNCMVTSK